MNSDRPEWYDRLRGNLFPERTDKRDFVSRLETRTFQPPNRSSEKWIRRGGVAFASLCAILVTLFVFRAAVPFGAHPNEVAKPTNPNPTLQVKIRDDASIDPGLQSFLQRIKAAVEHKDANTLISYVDQDITVAMMPSLEKGKERFIERWGLSQDAGQSAVWDVLKQLLSSGGRYINNVYFMPGGLYDETSSQISTNRNTFLLSTVVGDKVPLYSKPDTASNVIQDIQGGVVKEWIEDNPLPYKSDGKMLRWVEVSTFGGAKGYALSLYIHSDANYRMRIGKTSSGQWAIMLLSNLNE